jgi:hypothetical protein
MPVAVLVYGAEHRVGRHQDLGPHSAKVIHDDEHLVEPDLVVPVLIGCRLERDPPPGHDRVHPSSRPPPLGGFAGQ